MAKRKAAVASGGIEGIIQQVYDKKVSEAAQQGKVWCYRWGHAYHVAGTECAQCIAQREAWNAWERACRYAGWPATDPMD